MTIRRSPIAVCTALLLLVVVPARASGTLRPDQAEYRELFRELVETNTTLSSGNCTAAAAKMAARLRTAGLPDTGLHPFAVSEHPKEGGLVAVLNGRDPTARPILLLAHIDVVEARREDWTRDPFKLVEENGYFYARGVADDKAMASVWVDTFVRFLQDGFKPHRTLKLEVRNPGGHSSRPVKDNAIYQLAAGMTRLSTHEFPVRLNDATREYFTRMADLKGGDMGSAMRALVKDPTDASAVATVTADPTYDAMLRTTCVATMLDGGHASNALPQRARANVNCRIYPDQTFEDVRQELERAVADPEVKVTTLEMRGPMAKAPPLTPQIMKPIEQVAAKIYPGVPVLPLFQAGATDGQFLGAAGIPTYGIGATFFDPDLGGIHGLNERIRASSLYEGRDFLYELVKIYASSR